MAYSQTPNENIKLMNDHQIKKAAEHAIRNADLYSAIDYYEYLCLKKPNNNKYTFELAELYRKTRDYQNALVFYEKAYKADNEKYILALYFQAQMQKSIGEYEKSKVNLKKFSKAYKKGTDRKVFKKYTKMAIAGCDLVEKNKDTLLYTIIQHLDRGINKAHVEASPIYINEHTVNMVSVRSDEIEYYNLDEANTNRPKRNFHTIEKIDNEWQYKAPLDYPAEHEMQVSSGTFSKDKQRFYFTKCIKNWKNKMVCSIYFSERLGDGWSAPHLVEGPVNDPIYTATQPCIGINSKNDAEVLYFVSDRPGGKGGMDIWYSSYDPKRQSFYKVKNAGSKINSIGDELTPYFNHKSHALYFSSSYWPGYGGFDVFKTYGELKKWEEIENVGPVINSGADELNFCLSPSRETGMLVSNREGGISLKSKTCCDDLYEFKYTNFIQLGLEGTVFGLKDSSFYQALLKMNIISQSFIDSSDNPTRLDQFTVRLFLVNPKTKQRTLVGTEKTSLGEYYFDLEPHKDYELEVQNKNGLIKREVSTMAYNKSDTIHVKDFMIDIVPNEPIPLKNIYYEFDKSELTYKAKGTLDTTILSLMLAFKDIKVEILSHTDSKGATDYNYELSQLRAESVVNYLINKGLDKNRLMARGYGESSPLVSNANKDGSDCPEGRAKNRRTEFRIIGDLGQHIDYNNEPEDE